MAMLTPLLCELPLKAETACRTKRLVLIVLVIAIATVSVGGSKITRFGFGDGGFKLLGGGIVLLEEVLAFLSLSL